EDDDLVAVRVPLEDLLDRAASGHAVADDDQTFLGGHRPLRTLRPTPSGVGQKSLGIRTPLPGAPVLPGKLGSSRRWLVVWKLAPRAGEGDAALQHEPSPAPRRLRFGRLRGEGRPTAGQRRVRPGRRWPKRPPRWR